MTATDLKALVAAAVSMGYRQLKAGQLVWAKPVGFTLLIIDVAKWELKQLFVGAQDGEVHVFDSYDLRMHDRPKGSTPGAHFLECIKQFEAYQIHNGLADSPEVRGARAFHFISLEEQVSLEV